MLLPLRHRLGSDRNRSERGALSGAAIGVAVTTLVLAGCAEPDLPPDEPEQTPAVAEEQIDELEDDEELRALLAELWETLDVARDALLTAQEASTLTEADPAVQRALAALLVDPDAGTGDAGAAAVTPLLPSETVDRAGSATAPDLLSTTLSLAQALAGSLGRDTADVLRDPIAGDLGAWQHDPAGMVALAEDTAASATSIEALEPAILDLDGEGTRAIAWTFVARDADDLAVVQQAAERALTHVDLMRGAVDDVIGGV